MLIGSPVPEYLGGAAVKSPVFPNLEILDNLTLFNAADIRPALVRELTYLYVQKLTHTSEEERQYTELLLRHRRRRHRNQETRCGEAGKLSGGPGRGGAPARTRCPRSGAADPRAFTATHRIRPSRDHRGTWSALRRRDRPSLADQDPSEARCRSRCVRNCGHCSGPGESRGRFNRSDSKDSRSRAARVLAQRTHESRERE